MSETLSLESRVSMLEKKLSLLESRIKILEIADPNKSIDLSNTKSERFAITAQNRTPVAKFHDYDFTKEFNALSDLSGFDARTARKQFTEKFQVQAFSCSNYEYRMAHPDTPPEFKDESSVKGTFWAIPSGENFLVVPNLKTYEEQYHLTGGMQEAFASNFVGGRTYAKIQLIRPAVFAKDLTGWRIIRRGELKLY